MAFNKQLSIPFLNKVKTKDKALLARQLSTMLGAGLAVDQSFRILAQQTKNQILQKAYSYIIQDLEQGNSLSFALSRQHHIFDPVFIAIVRSGENTGQLDKVLTQLAERLELSEDFNNKVKSALYYPLFVVLTMIVIIILMMIYVIPQIKSVFADLNSTLPWTTRAIIAVSNFTVKFWWVELIAFVILFILFFTFIRSQEGGSRWDKLKIRIPFVKDLFQMIYMARFCRTMSMLIQAGVPIMETIAVSADVVQNKAYTESLRNVAAQVERGIPMSVPLTKDPNFPPIVSELILVGEQTGKMGTVLTRLAEYYEKETDTLIKGLASLIEPVILVIVGVGVGFLVISIIWPIYSIAQTGF